MSAAVSPPSDEPPALKGAGGRRVVPWPGKFVRRHRKLVLTLCLFGVTIACSTALILARGTVSHLGGWGYAGAFTLAVIGNAAVAVPFPWLLLVAPLGATLSPEWLTLWSVLGAFIGSSVLYGLGKSYANVPAIRWVNRRGRWTKLAIVAFLSISPVASYPALAAGALRVPAPAALAITVVGEGLKIWLAIHAVAFGLRVLGV